MKNDLQIKTGNKTECSLGVNIKKPMPDTINKTLMSIITDELNFYFFYNLNVV